MEAGTLRCPTCGASASPDATSCSFCRAALATVACPGCFGRMFLGAKFCSHCGERPADAPRSDGRLQPCPECALPLDGRSVGATPLGQCSRCSGVWLDVETFQRVCRESERQSAMLLGLPAASPAARQVVRYVPCPDCGKRMNRLNFARVSGVVVDVCKPHGVWFNRDELRRVVEFIRQGGMAESLAREREDLVEQRRRLTEQQGQGGSLGGGLGGATAGESLAGSTAGEVIFELLGWFVP